MHAVEIKNIRYDDEIKITNETPLGIERTTTHILDNIVITLSVDGGEDHELHFKPEAISNRQVGYELVNEVAAIEALAREMVFGWSALEPEGESRADINGGVHSSISVSWGQGLQEKVQELLVVHTDRLEEARKVFNVERE